jgi:hypothetical protein
LPGLKDQRFTIRFDFGHQGLQKAQDQRLVVHHRHCRQPPHGCRRDWDQGLRQKQRFTKSRDHHLSATVRPEADYLGVVDALQAKEGSVMHRVSPYSKA